MQNRRKYIRARGSVLKLDLMERMRYTIRLRIHFQLLKLITTSKFSKTCGVSINLNMVYWYDDFSTGTSGRNCETPCERFDFLSGVSITTHYVALHSHFQFEFSGTCFKFVICICSMFVIIVVLISFYQRNKLIIDEPWEIATKTNWCKTLEHCACQFYVQRTKLTSQIWWPQSFRTLRKIFFGQPLIICIGLIFAADELEVELGSLKPE